MPATTNILSKFGFSLINEAIFCLQEGIASPSDIDLAVVECLRLPKGPLKMAEEMGLATLSEKLEQLAGQYGGRFKPAPLLAEWVKEGRTSLEHLTHPVAALSALTV